MINFHLLLDTIRYLKPIQIRYRVKYFLKNRLGNKKWSVKNFDKSKNKNTSIELQKSINNYTSYYPEQSFAFLNIRHSFQNRIDWNFSDYGRLWTYNLNYFEFLNQEIISKDEGLSLIDKFIETIESNHTGMEPYPLSLRIINWIKFFAIHKINTQKYNNILWTQLYVLSKNKEYHLLGNHLLENGFALLFGAYYFRDNILYRQARTILSNELKEQILNDGAHFELSPMYHQVMLYRLLDCINLISNNEWMADDLLSVIKGKAKNMLGWLTAISFKDGNIPFLNDASGGIAPSTSDLLSYGKRLEIYPNILPLAECGYRKFSNENWECIFDVGIIGPSYQPGHAHADTFNIVLNAHGKPILVDTGCSTYETCEIRYFERGTKAHNTVTLNDRNSSEIWASHRVGRRAEVKLIVDTSSLVKASHSGYRILGISHERCVEVQEETTLKVTDRLLPRRGNYGIAYFHLDYRSKDIIIQNNTVVTEDCRITFNGTTKIQVVDYFQALEFNLRKPAKCIEVFFFDELVTEFRISD